MKQGKRRTRRRRNPVARALAEQARTIQVMRNRKRYVRKAKHPRPSEGEPGMI